MTWYFLRTSHCPELNHIATPVCKRNCYIQSFYIFCLKFLFYVYEYLSCIQMQHLCVWCPQRPEVAIRFPGTKVTVLWAAVWAMGNLGVLEKEPVLLPTQPSLQPWHMQSCHSDATTVQRVLKAEMVIGGKQQPRLQLLLLWHRETGYK